MFILFKSLGIVTSVCIFICTDRMKPIQTIDQLYNFGTRVHFLSLVHLYAAVIGFGIIMIGIAYLAPLFGTSVLQMGLNLNSVVGGPILSLFIMGIAFPCVDSWASDSNINLPV